MKKLAILKNRIDVKRRAGGTQNEIDEMQNIFIQEVEKSREIKNDILQGRVNDKVKKEIENAALKYGFKTPIAYLISCHNILSKNS